MTTQKHTTNPTEIIAIPKSDISISLARNPSTQIVEKFSLDKFELGTIAELPRGSRVSVIAKARFSEMEFDAGTVGAMNPLKDVILADIDKDYPLHLRVVVFDDGDKRILASCENLRVYEIDEGGIKSLLPVEPVDLGERLWHLLAVNDERPMLQVHSDPAIGMLDKVSADPVCQALVLPAAIRGAVEHLLRNRPDDDSECWQSDWLRYLASVQIELPEEEDDQTDGDSGARQKWIDETTATISKKLMLKTRAVEHLSEGQK